MTAAGRRRARAPAGPDPGTEIRDLHLWRLGPGHYALVVSLRATQPLTPAEYKARLKDMPPLGHVTIEVNQA